MEKIEFPAELQRQIEAEIIAGQMSQGKSISVESVKARYNANGKEIDSVLRSLHQNSFIFQEENGTNRILELPEAIITSDFQYAEQTQLKPSSQAFK